MAQRDITYCVESLQIAWYKAKEEYQKRFPNMAQPFLTCTYRSIEEQDALFIQANDLKDNNNNGLIDEPGECVTHARGGQSYHNTNPSKAFDIAFKTKEGKLIWDIENFQLFAVVIKEINPDIIWGGNWSKKKRDNPHFEIH